MAYPTATDLKDYLGITGSSEDTLLTNLITGVKEYAEHYCGRVFEGGSAAQRGFPLIPRFFSEDRRIFTPGADMASVTEVLNGDGSTIFTEGTEFVLLPVGVPPYNQIILLTGAGYRFSGSGLVKITAVWGYAATCPKIVFDAFLGIAAYLYRVRPAGGVGAVIQAGGQTIVQPETFPQAHVDVIRSLRRLPQ